MILTWTYHQITLLHSYIWLFMCPKVKNDLDYGHTISPWPPIDFENSLNDQACSLTIESNQRWSKLAL